MDKNTRLVVLHMLMCLFERLTDRFKQTGDRQDLDRAIALQRLTLDLCPPATASPARLILLDALGQFCYVRYTEYEDMADLDRTIEFYREAIRIHPPDQKRPSILFTNLASALSLRNEKRGYVEDLDEIISLRSVALTLLSKEDPPFSQTLHGLANSLFARFNESTITSDLNEAIRLLREAISYTGDHPDLRALFSDLGRALMVCFEHDGKARHLDECIEMERKALVVPPGDFPERYSSLSNLGEALRIRFKHGGVAGDLDESIQLHREALDLLSEGHPDRPSFLRYLGQAVLDRFQDSGVQEDLEESLRVLTDALDRCPDGHPDRSPSLSSLGAALWVRFNRGGMPEDLEKSIQLHREALALHREESPFPGFLNNLASALVARFSIGGKLEDLDESIQLFRDAAAFFPVGHPNRASPLSNLGATLWIRSKHPGRAKDLDDSIELHREALGLLPDCHRDRFASLSRLGEAYLTRFDMSERREDLEESIQSIQTALGLLPDGHPDLASAINDLGVALWFRFERGGEQGGSEEDLNESIRLHRDALALRPDGDRCRSHSFNNLANALNSRFKKDGRLEDLDECIRCHRDALSLLPDGHPERCSSLSSLGSALKSRFELERSEGDLDMSISYHRSAISLLPEGHPDRSSILHGLASALHSRFEVHQQPEDSEECFQLLGEATSHIFSKSIERFLVACEWTRLARRHNHSSTLGAYRAAISLLQTILTLRPTLSARHSFITEYQDCQTLAVDAASYAIERGDFRAAIELVEQGRAVLWTQMRGFRTPLDLLRQSNGPLADKFSQISSLLEDLVTSAESRSTGLDVKGVDASGGGQNRRHLDAMVARVRQLSEERDTIVKRIRKIPGFEAFLKDASFEELQKAALEGPVIVLNHSIYRCDALIVISRENEPCINVPLEARWVKEALYLCNVLLWARYKHKVDSPQYDEALQGVMAVLWDRVVSGVVQKLKELGIPEGSRIWWCPTRFLALLPFHAAGPYKTSTGVRYLLDDYISSYTPTLQSLIAARTNARSRREKPKLLFVGDSKLPSTKKERNAILKWSSIRKSLIDEKASPESVLRALRKAEWVHFACHGSLDKGEPFKSSFALPGGRLSLLDIAKANLPDAQFAFLSACHTAEQAPGVAMDESLHLAAGMQFCGFRSVVGTMWQLLDRDGPIFAEAVYGHLSNVSDEQQPRFKHAAAAVREAALYRRSRKDLAEDGFTDVDVATERWVNLIHIGA